MTATATANLFNAQDMNTLQEIGMTNPIVAAYFNVFRHGDLPIGSVLIGIVTDLAKENERLRNLLARKLETECAPIVFVVPANGRNK